MQDKEELTPQVDFSDFINVWNNIEEQYTKSNFAVPVDIHNVEEKVYLCEWCGEINDSPGHKNCSKCREVWKIIRDSVLEKGV